MSLATTVILPSPSEFDCPNEEDDEYQDAELVQRDPGMSVMSNPLRLPPDLALIAPYPLASPTLDYCIPAFAEFSDRPHRRALVDHFCNVLSHLIVFREESGNPFQQLVLPLSYDNSPVMNAIYALGSAHLEYRGVNTGEKSIYFHNQAIQGLAHLIEGAGKVNHKNEILAAIMLLVYYEVLVQRGRSNIVDGHLRGALTIMESSPGDSSPTSIFLERAFRFYDVITALSLGTAPIATAPAARCLIPLPPLDALPASPLRNVDTLLGMATTLWPIMHRLSNLFSLKNELENAMKSHQKSKIAVLRTEFENTSRAIETALQRWNPSLPPNVILEDGVLVGFEGQVVPEQPLLQSILHSALAYRHSAFVYLYRTIYAYAPSHQLVQKHVHASLVCCAQTVAFKGPMGALLWPLFVAACEAIGDEDRSLAKQAFVEFDIHQGMTNIENAWGVVREVWKQLDLLSVTPYGSKDADLWRRVSKEMGVCIVLG
ncbi:fungal-specific transcription factor domain-containing protein [Xylariales sp. AK1849]|nr:fungal-specific transcription factor domain-containing protein [Xylariales sp. AK1849]